MDISAIGPLRVNSLYCKYCAMHLLAYTVCIQKPTAIYIPNCRNGKCNVLPCTDDAMNFLVGKILELSSREVNSPVDVVDLGLETSTGYEPEQTNGANGYAKVSKINGLTQLPRSEGDEPKCPKNSCCSS